MFESGGSASLRPQPPHMTVTDRRSSRVGTAHRSKDEPANGWWAVPTLLRQPLPAAAIDGAAGFAFLALEAGLVVHVVFRGALAG